MGAIVSEMSHALAASGFTNSLDPEIVMAAYEWLASRSPYVAGVELS